MKDRVAFLYEAIVPFPYSATHSIVYEYRSYGASTAGKASGRKLEGLCHMTLINFAGHAVILVAAIA